MRQTEITRLGVSGVKEAVAGEEAAELAAEIFFVCTLCKSGGKSAQWRGRWRGREGEKNRIGEGKREG